MNLDVPGMDGQPQQQQQQQQQQNPQGQGSQGVFMGAGTPGMM